MCMWCAAVKGGRGRVGGIEAGGREKKAKMTI